MLRRGLRIRVCLQCYKEGGLERRWCASAQHSNDRLFWFRWEATDRFCSAVYRLSRCQRKICICALQGRKNSQRNCSRVLFDEVTKLDAQCGCGISQIKAASDGFEECALANG
ncbi:hypothetical protein OSTOST_23435 [Ostertagia ostertagi]